MFSFFKQKTEAKSQSSAYFGPSIADLTRMAPIGSTITDPELEQQLAALNCISDLCSAITKCGEDEGIRDRYNALIQECADIDKDDDGDHRSILTKVIANANLSDQQMAEFLCSSSFAHMRVVPDELLAMARMGDALKAGKKPSESSDEKGSVILDMLRCNSLAWTSLRHSLFEIGHTCVAMAFMRKHPYVRFNPRQFVHWRLDLEHQTATVSSYSKIGEKS